MVVNKISELLASRGLQNVIPEDKTLESLSISIKSWNKWVGKKSDPDMWQIIPIAEFLNCELHEIFPDKEELQIKLIENQKVSL